MEFPLRIPAEKLVDNEDKRSLRFGGRSELQPFSRTGGHLPVNVSGRIPWVPSVIAYKTEGMRSAPRFIFGGFVQALLRFSRFSFALLALLFLAHFATAQTNQGQIAGNVVDSTGASIPGAQVTAKNEATGSTYNATSTSAGSYRFPSIELGRYNRHRHRPRLPPSGLHRRRSPRRHHHFARRYPLRRRRE